MRQRPSLRFPIPHLESFPPRHPGSASAGFGTGLYAAPFRQRPGIRRCKARPSHAQRFLRLHPGSLAPMRQRPGLVSHSASGKFPAPHPGSLGVPPIRGSGWLPQPKPEPHRRQRPALRPHQGPPAKSPEALPPPKASFAGESAFLRVPRQAARAGLPVSEDISGRTPDTRQKSCGTLDQEPKRPPRQAAEVPHRQQ